MFKLNPTQIKDVQLCVPILQDVFAAYSTLDSAIAELESDVSAHVEILYKKCIADTIKRYYSDTLLLTPSMVAHLTKMPLHGQEESLRFLRSFQLDDHEVVNIIIATVPQERRIENLKRLLFLSKVGVPETIVETMSTICEKGNNAGKDAIVDADLLTTWLSVKGLNAEKWNLAETKNKEIMEAAKLGLANITGGMLIESTEKSMGSMYEGGYLIINHISKNQNIRKLINGCKAFGLRVLVVGQPAYDFSEMNCVTRFDSLHHCCEYVRSRNGTVVGVEITEKAESVEHFPFSKGIAFMLGNEGSGMSTKQKKNCDSFIVIPQYGGGTSCLNVVVAANIVMHRYFTWQQSQIPSI